MHDPECNKVIVMNVFKFPVFCYLFHESSAEWNNSKVWETREIFAKVHDTAMRTSLSLTKVT